MSIIRSRADVSTLSDADLVTRVRAGDTEAYGVLWERHARAGGTVARSYTSSFDPDDLVSEAYAKIFQAIRSGGGPDGAFRPYLFTTIRNTAAAWGRARRETAIEDAEAIEDPAFSEENSLNALDRSLTATAFRTLPTRWQEALWYSEVEGMTPQEIAPLLGMKANAVAALTYRAREGLRQAWIQAHLQSVPADSDCRWTIDRLGGYARKSLGKRDTARVDEHLHDCAKCTIVAAEAKDVGSRLALVLLPLAAGVVGATGYAAWMQTGAHTATYALGAGGVIMPAAAFGGATSGSTAGGSGGAASGSAGGVAGASGAAAGSAAGAGIGGVVVGASIVGALVIGGVVTAIALGPTLFGGGKTPSHSTAETAPSTSPAPAPSAAPSTPATPSTAPAPSPASAGLPAVPQTGQPAASVVAPTDQPSTPTTPPAPGTPGAPDVSTASVNDDGTLNARGTGTPGNTVSAALDAPTGGRGTARGFVVPSSLASTTIDSNGAWSLTADLTTLANGAYTLSFTESTPDGTRSKPITMSMTVAVDTTPSIVSPVDGARLTEPLTGISGAVGHADTVSVRVDGRAPQPATLDGAEWSVPVSGLANGRHTVTVVAVYRSRTESANTNFRLAVPPTVEIPHPGDPVTTPTLDPTGTGIPGNTIAVHLRDVNGHRITGGPSDDATVSTDGTWSCDLDLSALPDADYRLSVAQTAPDGTVSAPARLGFTYALAFGPPAITSPANETTLTRPLSAITGTVGIADEVQVRIDGGDPLTAQLGDGSWTVTTPVLDNGPHTVTASATYRDRGPKSHAATFTLAVPPGIDNASVMGSDVTVSGSGIPGNMIDLGIQASDGSPAEKAPTASVSVGADGTWTTTLSLAGLPNGNYHVSATQRGSAGDPSSAATSPIELRAPIAPPLITSADTQDGRYYPIVSGTAMPGATIVVSNGSEDAVSVQADSEGRWQTPLQLTGFAVGPNTVTAYQSDGYVESERSTVSFTLLTPTTSVTDIGISGSKLIFRISVTGDSGASVDLLADHARWTTVTLIAGAYGQDWWEWAGLAAGSVHTLGARYETGDDTRYGPESWISVTMPGAAQSRQTHATPVIPAPNLREIDALP